jgi:hypothetical protein
MHTVYGILPNSGENDQPEPESRVFAAAVAKAIA